MLCAIASAVVCERLKKRPWESTSKWNPMPDGKRGSPEWSNGGIPWVKDKLRNAREGNASKIALITLMTDRQVSSGRREDTTNYKVPKGASIQG